VDRSIDLVDYQKAKDICITQSVETIDDVLNAQAVREEQMFCAFPPDGEEWSLPGPLPDQGPPAVTSDSFLSVKPLPPVELSTMRNLPSLTVAPDALVRQPLLQTAVAHLPCEISAVVPPSFEILPNLFPTSDCHASPPMLNLSLAVQIVPWHLTLF
jgi:hypothetical protein